MDAEVDTPYYLEPTASDPDGDSLTFRATGLPPGISLNPGTGVLSGTPTTPGIYPITMTVTDGVAAVPVSLTLTIDGLLGQVTNTLLMNTGWNLKSSLENIDVQKVFGDARTFTSVWKWQNGN